MKNVLLLIAAALGLISSQSNVSGQDIHLHVNPKWKECSLQIDPSLTQKAWHQFTQEAGLVAYFRPLAEAKAMGARNYEVSILQWSTGIDESKEAWNNTFVHPDSTHWLTGGEPLAFPGLMFRAGVTDKIDVGAYWTKNVNANYGFWGGQVQYNFINDLQKGWAASARMSFVTLFGPKDLDLSIYGLDLLASKEFAVMGRASLSPYACVSTYMTRSHETTAVVDLKDESPLGVQAAAGVVAKISIARLAVEYNFAKINSLSFKLGVNF